MTRGRIMRSRCALALYDCLSVIVPVALIAAFASRQAYAYVDPSVMTYTIQALAGVAVALSAVLGVAFRRTRKKLFELLNIDENANKEVDPTWYRVDAGGNVVKNASGAASRRVEKKTKHMGRSNEDVYRPSWKKRIVIAAIVSLFSVFTLCIVAPFEIVAGSEGSLVFGLNVVWPIMTVAAIAIFAVLLVVLSVMRGRLFNIFSMLVFSLGLACWLQAMFLNQGLPSANGAAVNWVDYTTIAVVSLVAWLVVFVVPLAVSFRKTRFMQNAAATLSVILIIVQGVGVASIFASDAVDNAGDSAQTDYVMTKDGMFEVSANDNVIVFTLDTFDTHFLLDSCNEHPDLLSEFTGFTWYQNSTGSMIPTRYGNVFLLTGQYPEEGENFQSFLSERYKRSTYLSDIESAGYSIGLYTDTLGAEYLSPSDAESLIYKKTINMKADANSAIDDIGTFSALMQCAFYRDMPWVVKPFIWFYTDEINQRMSASNEGDISSEPYTINDGQWFQDLKNVGLSVDSSDESAFRYIHLSGTHWPYNLDENGEDIGASATLDQQVQAEIRMVGEYLRQLKELGLYDDATIIVTADHGDYYPIQGPLEKPTSPILLVKPAQSADAAAQSIVTSQAPVSASDILATVIAAVGGDSSKYGPTVFEVPENEARVRYYCETTNDENGYDVELLEYAIDGSALDMSDWELTGRTWSVW